MKKPSSAIEQIAYYLNYSAKTVKQIKQKLKESGFSEEQINLAVLRAIELDLLNDERFALDYTLAKRRQHWSSIRISLKLKSLGIDQDIINLKLEKQLSKTEDVKCAKNYIEKLFESKSFDEQYCSRRLKNKGFFYDVASIAIESYKQEHLINLL
ncbi:MAG: RecX family transcriptional regulator [Coriobacteriales bacterium]|nr:RecX family transcriptional regulator [Coriobacteriales bacterium]